MPDRRSDEAYAITSEVRAKNLKGVQQLHAAVQLARDLQDTSTPPEGLHTVIGALAQPRQSSCEVVRVTVRLGHSEFTPGSGPHLPTTGPEQGVLCLAALSRQQHAAKG